MTHNTEVEEVKQIARYIVQVVVDNWPEYHLMTGRERNRLFDGIKPILHHQLQKVREEERERINKERPKGINSKTPIAFWAGMPEYPSSDYVKGFNDCVSQTYYKIFNHSELDQGNK